MIHTHEYVHVMLYVSISMLHILPMQPMGRRGAMQRSLLGVSNDFELVES